MIEFFLMNGYAFYIWSSYFCTILVLGLIWFISTRSLTKTKNRLKELKFLDQMAERKDLDETAGKGDFFAY